MTKEEIEDYITKDYENLLQTAKFITRNDTASDLLNDVLINLLTRKDYSDRLNNCYNLYNYIFAAMKIQYFSNNSQYNKQYRSSFYDLKLNLYDNNYDDSEYDFTYEKIENFIKNHTFFEKIKENDIKKSKIKGKWNNKTENRINNKYINLNFICKKIFLEYFYNQDLNSLRKIEKKFRITHTSVSNYLHKLLDEFYNTDFYDILNKDRKNN